MSNNYLARFTPGNCFYVLITFNMNNSYQHGQAVGNFLGAPRATKSNSIQDGTSALHKIAAIGMSILMPGQAADEMRRDAFRK
jgi:hypothetical protein